MVLSRPLILTAASVALLAGCASDGDGSPAEPVLPSTTTSAAPDTTPPDTTPPDTRPSGGTLPTDIDAGDGAEVLQFEVASEVGCSGDSVEVTVTYQTRGVDVVAFAVDGGSAPGGAVPAGGVHDVRVPCDDRAHTIMLIGSGATGPVFASEAVVTRRT